MLPTQYVHSVQKQILEQLKDPELTLEQAHEMGLMARNLRDLSNWVIGQVALGIETRWGENELGDFAKLLGFNKSTILQYRWVVQKFGQEYIPGEGLPWSYYRLAAGTEKPEEFIDQITDKDLTYAEAQRLVRGKPIARECDHEEMKQISMLRCENCGILKPAPGGEINL